jgi:hypothetical protein
MKKGDTVLVPGMVLRFDNLCVPPEVLVRIGGENIWFAQSEVEKPRRPRKPEGKKTV